MTPIRNDQKRSSTVDLGTMRWRRAHRLTWPETVRVSAVKSQPRFDGLLAEHATPARDHSGWQGSGSPGGRVGRDYGIPGQPSDSPTAVATRRGKVSHLFKATLIEYRVNRAGSSRDRCSASPLYIWRHSRHEQLVNPRPCRAGRRFILTCRSACRSRSSTTAAGHRRTGAPTVKMLSHTSRCRYFIGSRRSSVRRLLATSSLIW